MNKYLFSLPLMAVVFGGMITSCSNDDDLIEGAANSHGQEIEFTIDINSRGNDVTTENLDSIWVYAYSGSGSTATERIPLTKFVKNSYGIFKPDPAIYWKSEWGDTLTFNAFGPDLNAKYTSMTKLSEGKAQAAVANVTSKPGDLKLNLYSPIYISEQFDPIIAKTTITKDNSHSGIPLVFSHLKSRVDFQVTKAEDSEYDIEVYGIAHMIATPVGATNKAATTFQYSFEKSAITSYAYLNAGSQLFMFNGLKNPITVNTTKQHAAGELSTYVTPQKLESPIYSSKPLLTTNSPIQYIELYAKVYDKKGNLIYPNADDQKMSARCVSSSNIYYPYIIASCPSNDWPTIGVSEISLNQAINYQAGHHYVITLDLTDGIGYYNINDKVNPSEPILNPQLSAKATVQEWVEGHLIDVKTSAEEETK